MLGSFSEGFAFASGSLSCGVVPVDTIASSVETPFWLYDLDAIVEKYRAYESAFAPLQHGTMYAMKANSSLAVLRALAGAGCGSDVNSRGELFRALRGGADPRNISMTGVGKSPTDIRDGLEAGIAFFNAESLEECLLIDAIAAERGAKARAVLRINPNVDAHTHPYIATGLAEHKFGLSEEDTRTALSTAAQLPHLSIAGFGMHLGSQLFSAAPYVEGVTKLLAFVRSVAPMLPEPVSIINIGGGIGVPYAAEDPAFDARAVVDAIAPILRAFDPALRVYSEPGRYLVANAGILVSTVEYVKRTNNRTFVILDAGMNDLIRPALYEAHHEIHPVIDRPERGEEVVDIAGPVCESGDTFAVRRRMQSVRPGERVAIFSAGAYGSVMSSNYNSRPLAAEVAVRGDRWFIARERQTLEDMVRNERDGSERDGSDRA
jgi:diaminopimelate decarboxylase